MVDIQSVAAEIRRGKQEEDINKVQGKNIMAPYYIGRPLFFIIIMAALWDMAGHYMFALWFLSSSFIFSSPILNGRRLDVYHTFTHAVALVRI